MPTCSRYETHAAYNTGIRELSCNQHGVAYKMFPICWAPLYGSLIQNVREIQPGHENSTLKIMIGLGKTSLNP